MSKEKELLAKVRDFAKQNYPDQMRQLIVEIGLALGDAEPQWYDNIPEHGVLCWVQDEIHYDKAITIIVKYNNENSVCKFISFRHNTWKYATPLTPQEILQFLPPSPSLEELTAEIDLEALRSFPSFHGTLNRVARYLLAKYYMAPK